MAVAQGIKQITLGVAFMDAAHADLAAALARLAVTPDQEFAAAFSALVTAIEKDFRGEEAAMEAIAYPGLQCHREQHARALRALHHTEPLVMEGDIAIGREALVLLPQWFELHQLTMDYALSMALLGAEKAPSATTCGQ